MNNVLTAFATILVIAITACGAPPPNEPPVAAETRAFVTLPAPGGARLEVSTPAFANGTDIPIENTQYTENRFPGLAWSAGPAATQSYVIILEDIDARMKGTSNPFLHWTMGNIPSAVTRLEPAFATLPEGSVYGPNYRGTSQPYAGPRTPKGPKHRYHFQVFALDSLLSLEAFASYDALKEAMKSHVIASGEVMGLGRFMKP